MTTETHGIVSELQRDCLNTGVSVSTILRKAKVIASKLELTELNEWISSELDGYSCAVNDLPEHRKGIGQPKFFNPYNGWCPIMTDDDWFGKMIRTVFLPQSVSELEELVAGDSSRLIMQYNPVVQETMQKQMPMPMECALHFSKAQITSALDYVRNKTLDWTLELENRGISGEGLSFGEGQKREAEVVTNHIYGGNFGVLGAVTGSVNNAGFIAAGRDINLGDVSELVGKIREAVPGLPEVIRADVESQLAEIGTELHSPEPSRSKISQALASMRTILEGAAGNLAASGALAAIASLST